MGFPQFGGAGGSRHGQVADRERVHEDQRRSICRRTRNDSPWRAASRRRPILSSSADHRAAARAGLCHPEARPQTAAVGQIQAAGRHAAAVEADRTLRRPDICAGLGVCRIWIDALFLERGSGRPVGPAAMTSWLYGFGFDNLGASPAQINAAKR